MKLCLATVLASFLLIPVFLVSAQTPCESVIIIPADFNYAGSQESSNPVQDCSNPFARTEDLDGFLLKNQIVVNNSIYNIEEAGTADYGFADETYGNTSEAVYYLHSGQDYVKVKTNFFEPTQAAYDTGISDFFGGNQIQIDLYKLIPRSYPSGSYFFVSTRPTVYKYDPVNGEKVMDVYNELQEYLRLNVLSPRRVLLPGTYTVVLEHVEIAYPTYEKSLLKKFFSFIIPTVYANHYVKTVTFTLAGPAPEPQGASSVLFLPGIMGSRLYEIGQQCGDFGEEQQRWFSTTDCMQLRLLTDRSGNSLNDIYTKYEQDSVIDEVYTFNLYKTFINTLADWKSAEIIGDYALVPYDWRMRLDQLLKTEKDEGGKIKYNPNINVPDGYIYKTLESLAASSTTGKVTIVAHSNGGLLAKTLLAILENTNDPLLAKIDNLIMVGSPQLGTPSTLLGMLHGDEIGPYGSIVSQLSTRRLMNTMPMAFHLLPNDSYFNSSGVTVGTPVITFENGTLTTAWVNAFGSSISNASILKTFLTSDSGRIKPVIQDLVNPEVVPKYLFDNYTASIDQLMNTWSPPSSMKVYQIAGTGLPTQTGITYFTDRECIAKNPFLIFKCIAYKDKIGFRPNETIDGDETVVIPSALAMNTGQINVERWWLNLDSYNSDGIGGAKNINRRHKDIFEVQDVINFIKNTVLATTSASYQYLTNTEPNLSSANRLVFDLHSPLDLSIVTSNGQTISSSSVTVEGAVYKRFGEMQHITMPNTSVSKTLKLSGEATGSFTLEIGEQTGNVVTKRHTYSAIPSGTSTKVIMDLETGKPIEEALLVVDYDGNGTAEIVYNANGEVVPEITYSTLRNVVNSLNIKSLYKKLLLENVKIAEQFQIKSFSQTKFKKLELLALNVLKQKVLLFERLKVLTPVQKQALISIIDTLLNK